MLDLVLADDVGDFDRQLALIRLDGHDGHRMAATARAVEIDEEQALALCQQPHPAAAVAASTGWAGERGQLRAQPVRPVHLVRV
jgi:hypothetical protein